MSTLISDKFVAWQAECDERFNRLKSNEEELNRIFIDIYGLQDELTPEVEDKDVTVRKADLQREIKSLISYAVGCMFGRYSLDVEGLAYAGGDFSAQWVVISGQYFKREVVEYYVSQQLSRSCGMAEINVSDDGSLSIGEDAAERGAICTFGSDAASSSLYPFQYRRGASKKLYEGICEFPFDCTGLKSRTGNTTYDLCSTEILQAIGSGDGSELVQRGWKNADNIDWQTIHSTLTTHHYSPDKDNVLPILDDEYFPNDIVARFVEFVRVVYGEDTLEENLTYIANALGGKGTSREVIRSYFLSGFYADHCKIYQKRPIYWLFDSGKKNGFKCLVYIHRYRPDTVALIRTDYVHEVQERYRTQLQGIEGSLESASPRDRVKLQKQADKYKAQLLELQGYEEKVHHYADAMIPLDLDDGVKVNYAKLQEVLAKIK